MFTGIVRNNIIQIRSLSSLTKFIPKHTSSQVKAHFSKVSSRNILRNSNIKSSWFSTNSPVQLDPLKFDEVCSETLESLCDYFEEIIESNPHFKSPDVVFGDGVLTIVFGEPYGTYVINRQTPNKQIWLSSPTSGPKRYDYVEEKDKEYWIYKHDGCSLHELLQSEISKISKLPVDFAKCSYSFIRNN